MGNEHQTRSRFRSADILRRLQGLSLARCVIQVLQSQDACNNGERNGQTRRQSLSKILLSKVCCFAPGTPLSPRPVGHRNSRIFRSVAGLWYLFQQHPSQPPVRAGLLPKEAPNDQSHEGQAEGQHHPPGPLLLGSQGLLHCPAERRGSAGGKPKGTVRVILFVALGRELGSSPAAGRRRRASGSPAHEPQRLERPGREKAVSARARPFGPRSHRDPAQLTRPPARTERRSSRPRLSAWRRRAPQSCHFRRAKPEVGCCSGPPLTTTERGSPLAQRK